MKTILLTALLIITMLAVRAQTPDSQLVLAHLEPIYHAPGSTILGPSYYYKGRRLSAPFSVEVPIMELNDPVASMHFRRFRTWTNVGRLTGLASVAYVLFNRTPDPQTRRVVYVSSLVASVGFSLLSNSQANKAVRRYNAVVGAPRLGLSTTQLFNGQKMAFVGLQFPFLHKVH